MLLRSFSCANFRILPDTVLSHSNKANCLCLLNSMNSVVAKKRADLKKAAVLVPLCKIDEELAFLYTVRALKLKVNGGQVSFPGGMHDNSDGSLKETALRETFEEVGISPENINVWGKAPEIIRSDLSVTPFLGYVGDFNLDKLKINSEEVSMIFLVSLNHLSKSENFGTTQFRLGNRNVYTAPIYFNASKRIWGLTAFITHTILSALIPSIYNANIKFKPNFYKIIGTQ